MALTAESALPLQKETTDKKRKARMSPIGKYFKGKGEEVLGDMKDRYGEDKGKSVFHATATKNKMRPDDSNNKKPPKRKSVGQMIAEG